MENTKEAIYNLIKDRTNRNPVPSRDIEYELEMTGSEVREYIRELRRDGVLIGSISRRTENEGGYYIIDSEGDFNQTIQHLENRITSMRNTIYKMQIAWINKNSKQQEMTI
jgi:biotin operon repressor